MRSTFSKYKKLIIDKIRKEYGLEGCLCKTPISYLLDYLNKSGNGEKKGKEVYEIRCYKSSYMYTIPNYYLYGYLLDEVVEDGCVVEKLIFEKSFGSIVSTEPEEREKSILPIYIEHIEDSWYVPSNIFKEIYKFLEDTK